MNNLQSNDLMALSFLIDEEIYCIKEEIILNEEKLSPSKTENKIEELVPPVIIKDSPSNQRDTDFKYLGENNKYILIIVKEPDFDFLNQNDLGFLLKILAAKKLELKDVAIINLEKNNPLTFDDLKAFFACNKIITFGFNPQILQIESAVANKKSIFKDTAILGTWDLTKLQQDVKKKGIFWDELKSF